MQPLSISASQLAIDIHHRTHHVRDVRTLHARALLAWHSERVHLE